jgi:16S rRNA G1207 methylase RsmC
LAGLSYSQDILEPSAGTGELADTILEAEPSCNIYVIEKNEQRSQVLKNKGYQVIGTDFFDHKGRWARIIQNPPFEEFQDIAHVRHAYECLAPGGRLVSVMGEGAFFRNNGLAAEFRGWLDELGGYDIDLLAGAFKSSGTNVKARLVVIDKPPNHNIAYVQAPLFAGVEL